MNFPLIHTGRRFFFFTFVVEGRQPVLSRPVRGKKRPQLLPIGERVVEFWLSLHKIEPRFTASDFVIMPDHVHLLLIVNSVGEFRFNPLVFAHRFMEATANDGVASDGGCRPRPPANAPAGGPGGAATRRSFAWLRDYWIDISFDSRQLAAIRRYIKMNPARYFWKLDNPDMFRFRANLRHPILDASLPWSAIGDITILATPFLYLVRLTMKKTIAELEDEIAAHIERAKQGWTPVCGFISPGEREFERRLKALPRSRWIKTVPYGLPERYDPSVEDSRWLTAHRQLILSSFDRAEIAPFKITRPGCLAMNARIAAMVAANDGGCPPTPGTRKETPQ
ncbi:MAG: hypothetical protein IJQ34_07640 [Kiritimatiellae bacterium]|nr:hypothetical protein [Kiritimatiellia bacterium]